MDNMIKNYLKMLVYYSLTVVESVLNFVGSVVGYYPKLEFSTNFLVALELFRVEREIGDRLKERETMENEADAKVKLAKEMDDGKNEKVQA